MDEQTKIGTGAAAVIALLSLLEPHLFESHPVLAAVIYVVLVSVAAWGFSPAVMRAACKLLGPRGLKTMWPQYLMVAGGCIFFVGFVAFLQMNVSPPSKDGEIPKPPPAAAEAAKDQTARQSNTEQQTAQAPVPVQAQNVGVLKSPVNLIYSAEVSGPIPLIQIGDSGVVLGPPGSAATYDELRTNEYQQVLMPALEATGFRVETIGGELKVSSQIADENGRLIAAIERNEWKVAPSPQTWDRNYNDSALEVKDDRGRVVLQVRLLPDRIQLQGVWPVEPQGRAAGLARVVLRKDPNGSGAQFAFLPINPRPDTTWPEIRQIFRYPSEFHLGELDHPPQTAQQKFQNNMADVAGMGRATADVKMRLPDGSSYSTKIAIYRSWMAKKTFVALYVPEAAPTIQAITRFSDDYKGILDFFDKNFHAVGHIGKHSVDQSELTFSGVLYVFHEAPISSDERASLINDYREKRLTLVLLHGDSAPRN